MGVEGGGARQIADAVTVGLDCPVAAAEGEAGAVRLGGEGAEHVDPLVEVADLDLGEAEVDVLARVQRPPVVRLEVSLRYAEDVG